MVVILLIFFVFIFFVAFYPPRNEQAKKSLFWLVGICLAVNAGLRESVDLDYVGYLSYYNSVENGLALEPTFHIISYIVRNILFDNVIFLFLIYAILGVILKMIAIKQLTNLWFLSLLIYLSFLYILQDMTQIRAGVATGILLLCIKPLYERNFKRFILYVIIATLFHYSALLILPLWFLKPVKINTLLYASLIPIAYCCHFLDISFSRLLPLIPIDAIQNKAQLYIDITKNMQNEQTNVFNIIQVLKCFVSFFLLWKINLITVHNKYAPLLLKIYILSAVFFLLFSDIPGLGFRGSELLGIVEIIVIPLMVYAFSPSRWAAIFPVLIGAILIYVNLFYTKLIM